jgi:hypothetical protein
MACFFSYNNTILVYLMLLDLADWQDLIHRAHRHIESETCIRFIENGTGTDYLLYTRGSGELF